MDQFLGSGWPYHVLILFPFQGHMFSFPISLSQTEDRGNSLAVCLFMIELPSRLGHLIGMNQTPALRCFSLPHDLPLAISMMWPTSLQDLNKRQNLDSCHWFSFPTIMASSSGRIYSGTTGCHQQNFATGTVKPKIHNTQHRLFNRTLGIQKWGINDPKYILRGDPDRPTCCSRRRLSLSHTVNFHGLFFHLSVTCFYAELSVIYLSTLFIQIQSHCLSICTLLCFISFTCLLLLFYLAYLMVAQICTLKPVWTGSLSMDTR